MGLPSDLLRRRPDIRRAEAQLHAATARIGVATADLFPRFFLTGNAGVSASDLTLISKTQNSKYWSFSPSVTWPVFAAGRIRWNIELQDAKQQESFFNYQKTVLNALKEVETALVAYAKEQEHWKFLAQAVENNRRAVDLSMKLYLAGKTDFLNVLTAQRALFLNEEALAQSNRTLVTNLIALYKALGGGWENYTVGQAVAHRKEYHWKLKTFKLEPIPFENSLSLNQKSVMSALYSALHMLYPLSLFQPCYRILLW